MEYTFLVAKVISRMTVYWYPIHFGYEFSWVRILRGIKSPAVRKYKVYTDVQLYTDTYNFYTAVSIQWQIQDFQKGGWVFFFFWGGGLFMPPAWKVRQGHLAFGSTVCPSVCNSVPLTGINKVQYLKLRWSYSNQTLTVSSSEGCSHFTDLTCLWGWAGSKCRT